MLPETPCDKCFHKKEECSEKEIACSDLVHYINKGFVRDEDRMPDKSNFLKINPATKVVEYSDNTIQETGFEFSTLQKELKLLNRLRTRSLEEIEKFFDNKTTFEKAKIACVVYGLVLRSDDIKV